ncbi:MAG: hypothetical protein COA58_01015 [Bacteroidetes bacterium]|nr:MAG: hypothetical protein COA58_01015 [Bacteroidota bacterium]
MNRIFIGLALCVILSTSRAQSKDSLEKSNPLVAEVFFNISGALGKATGNVNSTTFVSDPVLIGMKVKRQNSPKAIRAGLNFHLVSSDELSSQFQRVNTENFYSLSLGFEKRKDLGKNLEYYYGIDARYYHLSSHTETFFITNSSIIRSIQNGPGIAPLLGFKWKINERFELFTETSFSFEAINKYRYLTSEQGFKTVLEDKLVYSVRPVAPGSIFLTFKL